MTTRSRLASGVLASALVSGVLVAVPGGSAHAAVTPCPASFPTADVVDGLTGTGWTVERGVTPEPFTARILGRITDGIAPGVDMIMADLDSPALTRAGGVWAGMSGSPVYAGDGRLIGAVSYGLAAASPIAGLTPAADLKKLLSAPAGAGSARAGSARAGIRVGARAARRIARTGDVSAAAAGAGFAPLPMPLSVSGAARDSTKFLQHLSRTTGATVRSGGAAIGAAASSPAEITAGGNFAAALSYGDVSIAGVGTTTFVCDGEAVAFGHPMDNRGSVQFTAHPATAVYVQADPVNGPFKVANPGGPVGIVDQDRTTGIRARLGSAATAAFPVTSSLVPPGRPAVTGSTTGIYQPYAADIAALHLQANVIKALGAEGAGSAALTFTIKGMTAAGSPFTLARSDHYADPDHLSYAVADDLYNLVQQLLSQSFKDVIITSVDVTGTVDPTIQQYRVTGVKMFRGGRWVPQRGTVVTSPGRTIYRQITLSKYRDTRTVIARMKVKIPARTHGATGSLVISNALNSGYSGGDPTSLTGLLKQLQAYPPNDALAGTLLLEGGRTSVNAVTLTRVDAKVTDYFKSLNVIVQ